MIEDIDSPLERKMKLIPLLVHMHHDTNLSAQVRIINKNRNFLKGTDLILILLGQKFMSINVLLVSES